MRQKKREPAQPVADGVELGTLLAARRQKLGMSMDRLAEIAEVSSGTVYAIEHGNADARLTTLLRLTRALDLKLLDVLEAPTPNRLSSSTFEEELARRAKRDLPSLLKMVVRLYDTK